MRRHVIWKVLYCMGKQSGSTWELTDEMPEGEGLWGNERF